MVHIGLFFILVLLFFIPFIKEPISLEKKKLILVNIALAALTYGIAMEFVQKSWIPNRSFDFFDIVADGTGSFLPLIPARQIIDRGNKSSK
ncbi:MAG: VanZ family protein [Chitinophagaceae bacterium]